MNKHTLTNEELSFRLRRARELAGLSQAQAAKLLGMSRPTISEIEAGRRKVPSIELLILANLYDVSVSWLVGDEDAPDPALQLVARKLSGLSDEDIEQLLELLKMVNRGRDTQ